ncbi:hypothetical protein BHE74_00040980 [Ensete ventricosum]|nr:hypothetical protein BHE74_00040980 [Ensete ventricosum]
MCRYRCSTASRDLGQFIWLGKSTPFYGISGSLYGSVRYRILLLVWRRLLRSKRLVQLKKPMWLGLQSHETSHGVNHELLYQMGVRPKFNGAGKASATRTLAEPPSSCREDGDGFSSPSGMT